MTDFLHIGAFVVPVQVQGATERVRRDLQSEAVPTFSLTLRRMGRGRKREWGFLSAPISQADYDSLLAAAAPAFVLCTGASMPSGGVSCLVMIEDAPYIEDTEDANGFKRVAQITCLEKG